MRRRQFLGWSVSAALAGSISPVHAKSWVPDFSAIRLKATGMDAAQWQVMAAVQAHLFPSEANAPGAADVNAAPYLQWVLSDPSLEKATRDFIRRGVVSVMSLSSKEYGGGFPSLAIEQKEQLLRKLEAQPHGQDWLREVLTYILEATLTDPVYGGNPGAIGWKWLAHRPGYKRPPADKRYFLL
ncbi:gluconate 2-dehydrogenase subunit 3 family protein [Thiolapillus sp.]|uniref:gluconate 2-dehydrogenase subunit 3 family protein n=1 Tax=Thiolapillus sp. TaxID=2017437 RepID=UPI0025D3359D|nr:gluconate 2-dehydrogenase subunit 3 family protein [Thiolapillus sp.]